MLKISQKFPVTEEEYVELNDKFGQLCNYVSWQLIKKNSNNNHTDEFDDIVQELRIKLLTAGSYYKRQVYIENCFKVVRKYANDDFTRMMLDELEYLWKNKTRHGANRQKFGELQETLLEDLLNMVPNEEIPSKDAKLKIDSKFSTYCKAIAWNCQKTMGKRITKEKAFRSQIASLSEFEYLATI